MIIALILTGCDAEFESVNEYYEGESQYFKVISSEDYFCGFIIYDTRTGVEYWVSNGAYNCGTLTLLVDAEGKPLIYKGE